jgi:hypothetical protein
MKPLTFLLTFLFLEMGPCHASPELDVLEGKIRTELPGSEWQLVKDWRTITISHHDVRFLNPISLPFGWPDDQLWNKLSFTSDYRITITLDSKVTQSEYDELLRLKMKLTAERTAGAGRNTRDFASISRNAEGVVRLPIYYSDRFSVYLYTSDDNFFTVRPDSIVDDRDKVLALLEKSYTKYTQTAEQAGAGQPATKPADKPPGTDKPSTPTPTVGPR